MPLYKNMYNYMMSDPTLLTSGNPEGIERVYNGSEDYGFLMESKSIEYETERKCNLTQVGDPLDDKNYGIGMRKSLSIISVNQDILVHGNFIIFIRISVSLPTKRRNFAASREGSVGNTVQKVVERTSRWWRLFGKCVFHNLILFQLK